MGAVTATSTQSRPGKSALAKSAAMAVPRTAATAVAHSAIWIESKSGVSVWKRLPR